MDRRAVLVANQLTKVYEPTPQWMRLFARTHISSSVTALAGVDLTLKAGEICAIVGPNGAGKTTLFRIIVGLTSATSGSARVLGYDCENQQEDVRRAVGWMPSEDRSLLMRATCAENLHLHGRLQGMPLKRLRPAIPEVLERVGLQDQSRTICASLSAGMRARLRLARALLPQPQVLLLDEPTGAIDPVAAHELLGLITNLVREQRLGALLSSHRLEEIESLHSHALLLDKGRIRFEGDLDDLRDQWDRPQVEFTCRDAESAVELGAQLVGLGIVTEVTGRTVCCRSPGDALGEVLESMGRLTRKVERIRERPMPLRDLISRVYATDLESV